MRATADKREAYALAQQLLDSGDDESLRYAALELRRCLEAIVYEKLWVYRDRIPDSTVRKWQPPQAFKALIAVEPEARRTASWSIAPQKKLNEPGDRPFRHAGVDHRPDPKWLTKAYNKLGSMLHVSYPFRPTPEQSPESVREYLRSTVGELERFITSSFTMNLAETMHLSECQGCGEPIVANAEGVRQRGYFECLNHKCQLRYVRAQGSGDDEFVPEVLQFVCRDCEGTTWLSSHLAVLGHEFECSECASIYVLTLSAARKEAKA